MIASSSSTRRPPSSSRSPASAAWLTTSSRIASSPHTYTQAPLWGDETHLRELFAAHDVAISFTRATNLFAFDSVDGYQTFFEERYGPTIKAQEKLAPAGRWEDCRAELRGLFDRMNVATDGSCRIEAEYAAISIVRAGRLTHR